MKITNEINCKTVGAHDCAQKGITLIALIITIIVMLILVGVTINMAVNGGLFNYAGKATSDMQNAIDLEQQLASGEIKIGDSWYNSMDDYLNGIESVKSLQEKYEFEYYSSLAKAVTDVNNNTRDNADSDKENAVAGIYTEDGKTTVVLLKDTTEEARVQPSVDMTINLGGKTFSTNDKVGVDILAGNVNIDGRLNGSTIEVSRTDGSNAKAIQFSGICTVNGGTYISKSNGAGDGNSCILVFEGELNIKNASIICTDVAGMTKGIVINPTGIATISNCNIETYSNYSEVEASKGIVNFGTSTINNCNVMGTQTAVENQGTLYVNGGTYEGFGFGGFDFCGEGNTSYVRNATIRECEMPEGYTATSDSNNSGFYIRYHDNVKVYMNNCDIYGSRQPIVLQGTNGEQNNTLYISNSKINTDQKIRIDDGGHKLYIGKGCNFTAEHTNNPSAVISTDEVYTQAN